MVRIVLADPDAKERNRLRQHLSDGQHQEVVGLARDGQEAVQLTLQTPEPGTAVSVTTMLEANDRVQLPVQSGA